MVVKWLKAPRSQGTWNILSWLEQTKCSTQQNKSASFLTWTMFFKWQHHWRHLKKHMPLPTFLHLKVFAPFESTVWCVYYQLSFPSPPDLPGIRSISSVLHARQLQVLDPGDFPDECKDGLFGGCFGHLQNRKISVYASDSSQRLEDFKIFVIQSQISCSFLSPVSQGKPQACVDAVASWLQCLPWAQRWAYVSWEQDTERPAKKLARDRAAPTHWRAV